MPSQPRFDVTGPHQVIPNDFPDPGIPKVGADWDAFVLNTDALASLGPWETPLGLWAPDFIVRDDGQLALYYSGRPKESPCHHCVVAAIAEGQDPAGPYHPLKDPFACHMGMGGSIDSAGFLDKGANRWVLYKEDGNSMGNRGCLREQHSTNSSDARPLTESGSLVLSEEGVYFLFYSSHCWTTPEYDGRYATSRLVTGPHVKAAEPLIKSGDNGLKAPGGATNADDGERVLFHANRPAGRCTYAARLEILEQTARIV
ncbi:hypothetical protein AJ78_02502 [Emergomyces pasteurianus Ep9510]|uniref:Uncharacterized protein n=1 Tax=Emergomyces pasteurianus Ep9510 TaxID=1447872 RepID=A0A1J9QNJ0_9EURO|nr:hypothetical protein AJ78_02502 [Emergomyces pasteurianus Ep9510]